MNISIDHDAVNQGLYNGKAITARSLLLTDGWRDLPAYPYDLAKAKQLMKDAGYEQGFSCDIWSPTASGGIVRMADECAAYVGYWSKIGINVKIVPRDYGQYHLEIMQNKTKGVLWTLRLGMKWDPAEHAGLSNVTATWPGYWHADDSLVPYAQAILAEQDMSKRTALWAAFTKKAAENFTNIPMCTYPRFVVVDKAKVGDWPTNFAEFYYNFEYIRHATPLKTFRLYELR